MANDDFDLPRPTDAVPSATSAVINDDAKVLDYVVNSTGTVTTRTGKQIMTIDQAIQSAAPVPLNGGVWASGQTFEFYNQYMYYDGLAYAALPATTLPYTVGAAPDLGFVYQIKLNDHSLLSELNAGGGHDAIYDRKFSDVQSMIDYTSHFVGARYSSGATVWAVNTISSPMTIADFSPKTEVFVHDFGLDSAAFQSAVDVSFSVNFGGAEYTYIIDDPVGLPENDIRSDKFIALKGSGAKIVTDSPEAIITSKSSLADPDTTDDLFSGSILVDGISFSGKTPNLKTANIFNGDRLYNVEVTNCSFDDLNYIAWSYRQKGTNPVFAEGYFQSFFIDNGNRIHDVNRIYKGSKAMNIGLRNNFLEGDIRLGVDIQSDFGSSSVEALRINGNVYEGGGMLFNLGAVFGFECKGNYFEKNDRYTALDEHAMGVFDSSVPSGGLDISGNFIFINDTGDASYATFKWKNYTEDQSDFESYWKGCSIRNNFCNTQALIDESCPVRDVNNNSVPFNTVTNKPKNFVDSAIDAFDFTNEESSTAAFTTGIQDLFKLGFTDTKLNADNRNFHIKVKLNLSHISYNYPSLPNGKYQTGADYFEIDILFFFRKGFSNAEVGMNAVGKLTQHVPAVGTAGGGSVYASHWPSGASLVLTPVGDDWVVQIDGYVRQTDTLADSDAVISYGVVTSECAYRDNISLDDVMVLSV